MDPASHPLAPLAAAVLQVPAPERALVVNCGEGEGVLFLAREFPAARVRGLDRSAEAVRRAVARVGLDPEGRVAFKQGSPRSLPYPDGIFDLVVWAGGAPRPREARRVLAGGGHLIQLSGRRRLRRGPPRRGFEPLWAGSVGGGRQYVGRLAAE